MGEIIGDEVVAVAMIDRVHHAEILWLKGAATACAIAYWAAPARPSA